MIELEKLKKQKSLENKLRVKIVPQGPLSIIGKVNSKYKKLDTNISDNTIYGLLENIMGFHLDRETRKEVCGILKIKDNKTKGVIDTKGKLAYRPIINNVCAINNIDVPENGTVFTDIFPSLSQRSDAGHFSAIKDYSVKGKIDRSDKNPDPTHLLKGGKLGMYYTTIQKRDYIIIDSPIIVDITTNSYLEDILIKSNETKKMAFLGNSESIVNVYIDKV